MDIHSLAKMDIGASKQQSNFAKAQKPRSATQQSKPNEVNSDPCTTCAQACPKPILICTECADGTDQHGTATTTIYCDTKCRAADTKHAKLCAVKNQQKELHRSGEILQAIWFIWREVAFDMKLSHIEKKKAASGEDLLFFHEGDYTDHNEGPLYPLPALANMDEKDKQAVITLNSCGDAMGFLHGLSKKLLAGGWTLSAECPATMIANLLQEFLTEFGRTTPQSKSQTTTSTKCGAPASLSNFPRYTSTSPLV